MEDSRKSQIIPVKIGWADLKHRYWHNRYNHRLVLVGCGISYSRVQTKLDMNVLEGLLCMYVLNWHSFL